MSRQLSPRIQLMQVGAIALATYILLAGTGAFWRLELKTGALLLLAGFAAGFGWLAWRQGWIALLLALLPPALLPLIARVPQAPGWLVSYHQTLQQQVFEFIRDIGLLGPEAGFGLTLGQLFLTIIGLSFAAVAAREALGRGRAFITLMLGSAIFGSQWAFFWEPAAGYGAAFAAVSLLLWILASSGYRQAEWAESGRKVQYPSQATAPIAGVLLVALGARILPADFLPGTADLFASITESLPFLEQLRGNKGSDGEFGLLSTGFSPNGSSLGGPVQPNDAPALEVRLPGTLDQTLYLRGAVYEQFNGSRWQQAPEAHGSFTTIDTVPSYLHPEAFRQEQQVEIKHLQTYGRSLFSPLEAYKLDGLDWEVDGAQMLRSTARMKRNQTYTVTVKLPDWSSEQIRLLERQALGLPIPEDLLPPGEAQSSASTTVEPGQVQVIDVPLNLPPGSQVNGISLANGVGPVPSPGVDPTGDARNTSSFYGMGSTRAVFDYTRQLMLGAQAQTPYEKAVALETWFRSAFPYDLDAPAPRPGQNFVQFFLFEAQRGYCTYFASAMTLMLQLSGVQARMVEGFALPASATLTRGADGTAAYVVTNAMAHAWVEAWIPGYGWVTFDPTPRADIPVADRSRPLVAPEIPTGGEEPTPTTDPTDDPNDPRLGPRNQEDDGSIPDPGTSTATQGTSWPLVALVTVLIGLIVFTLLRLRWQAPRLSLHGRTGVTEAWSKAEGLLHRFGWGRKAAQTPQEWAVQVGERVRNLKEPLHAAASDYTLARWGPPGSNLDPVASTRGAALWQLVTQAMRDRYGTFAYFWYRLRWAPRRK